MKHLKNFTDSDLLVQCSGLLVLGLILIWQISGKPIIFLPLFFLLSSLLLILKPDLILYLFILSFFFNQPIISHGWMLSVQLTDLLFPLIVVAFLANKNFQLRALLSKQKTLFYLFTLFTLWAIVGFVINFYLHTTFENITSLFFIYNLLQMVICILLFSQPQWKDYKNKVISFFLFCITIEIFVSVFQAFSLKADSLIQLQQITGTFSKHHGMLGNVMALSLAICFYGFFEFKEKLNRLLCVFIFILSLVLIFLSGSRSSILGLMLAIPFSTFLLLKNTPKKLILWGFSFILCLALFLLTPLKNIVLNALVSSQTGSIDLSTYGRLLIWERVLEHFLSGPWVQKIFGIGIGTFNSLRFSYYLEVGTFTTGAHNNFFHVFVEAGLVGLLIFILILLNILMQLVRNSRGRRREYVGFLFVTLLLLFSCVTQETFWFNPSFGRFWLLFLFLFLIICNYTEQPDRLISKENAT